MRKIIFICLVFLFTGNTFHGQQQFAFSFGETPQTLLLNPGAETNFKYHYGIPVFSNFNLNVGMTGFDLSELFLADGEPFDAKFGRVLDQLDENDYINFNTRIDILNGGFRYDNRTYLSFGFYHETDVMIYIPKDIIDLGYRGNNAFINRAYSFSHLTLKADILGVMHFGISRKVNPKLNIGARLKIYSSTANVESSFNSGTLTRVANNTNLTRYILNDLDAQVRTSGLIDSNDEFLANPGDLISNSFLGGNLGLGLDFGVTYHATPQLELTASILDFGFVKHSKNTRVYSAEGDYTFDGINFTGFDPANPIDYWQQLGDDFKENVPNSETQDPYTSWRPTKLNAALKYSFEIFEVKHVIQIHSSVTITMQLVFRFIVFLDLKDHSLPLPVSSKPHFQKRYIRK